MRRCCLIHLKNSCTCQRHRYKAAIVTAGSVKLLVRNTNGFWGVRDRRAECGAVLNGNLAWHRDSRACHQRHPAATGGANQFGACILQPGCPPVLCRWVHRQMVATMALKIGVSLCLNLSCAMTHPLEQEVCQIQDEIDESKRSPHEVRTAQRNQSPLQVRWKGGNLQIR
jgi:hypothetical protein